MKCGAGILKRWEQSNQWRNLGASPIKIQVEEDEANTQHQMSNSNRSVLCSLDVKGWTLDVF
ncbi:MAG: hypothetical protein DME68_01220 [Verrucomicrobia bacterium]|nr:MAG: hypothetical protein DME68_01220 [Verrucomicrobiota bacterium]